jgi:hypothetical protein
MTRSFCWKAGLACIALILSGCLSTPPAAAPTPANEKLRVRNNAASLLHHLLGDEKNVSKLLIIKRDRDELNRVIKHVASVCGDAHKKLAQLAKEDSSLNLDDTALPLGEKAARVSESEARGSELLHTSGDDLEFKLLLTQAEALAYATHLAKVAALNEPQPQRAREFSAIRDQMQQLHDEVIALLKAQRIPPGKER